MANDFLDDYKSSISEARDFGKAVQAEMDKYYSEVRKSSSEAIQSNMREQLKAEEKIYKEKLRDAKNNQRERELVERTHAARQKAIREEAAKEEKESNKRINEDYYKSKIAIEQDTQGEVVKIRRQAEKHMTALQKSELIAQEKADLEKTNKELENRKKVLEDRKKRTGELSAEQQEELNNINKSFELNSKNIKKLASEEKKRLDQAKQYGSLSDRISAKQAERAKKLSDLEKNRNDILVKQEKNRENIAKAEKKLEDLREKGAPEEDIAKAQEKLDEAKKEKSDLRKEYLSTAGQEAGAGLLSNLVGALKDSLSSALTSSMSAVNNAVNAAIDDAVSHRTKLMARLQSMSGEYDYDATLSAARRSMAGSAYVSQKTFLAKLDEAVDKGIAYNVEQRAFLQTVSDSIATTFDAFDSSLLRLIKLQQADSTAARLGMEASLTKTLNTLFSDTSYLNNLYDSVAAAILDSEAIMTRDAAAEFEYVVQKWMGALYSLGISDATISQIAQGINYIGTGNVQALASSTPLQTLFAMSASRANLDYANLLTGGLSSQDTNKLLKSMVEYLQEIAQNSGNNVVRSAYGDLYNMSLADMRAVSSLTSSDIDTLYSLGMSYSSMVSETSNQFSMLSKRFTIPEMVKNIKDNFIYSLGSDIASSAGKYITWAITDLIESTTGGIHLPAISVFGNMLDLSSFTVEGLVKTGLVGISTLGQIGNLFSSLAGGPAASMGAFNFDEYLERGQISTRGVGSYTSTSGSVFVGSGSSSDVKQSALSGAVEESAGVEEMTSADRQPDHTFDDWYNTIIIDNTPITVVSGEDYTTSDIYTTLFVDKNSVPVYLDYSSGLGKELMQLANVLTNPRNVMDVNIKSSDAPIKTSVSDLDPKLKDSIKSYIKQIFMDQFIQEFKKSVVGNSSSKNATIADICEKIMHGTVDTVITNDNFDDALLRYSMFGAF